MAFFKEQIDICMSHPKWNLSMEETHVLLSELVIVEKKDSEKIKKIDFRIKNKRVVPIKKPKTKTLKELKEQAKELGIKGYYSLKKTEIEEAINKIINKKKNEITSTPDEFIKSGNTKNLNDIKDSKQVITNMPTVKDLKEKCRQLKIKGFSKMNKSDLEEAISNKTNIDNKTIITRPIPEDIDDNISETYTECDELPVNIMKDVRYNTDSDDDNSLNENYSDDENSESDFFTNNNKTNSKNENIIEDELEIETDFV